MVSNGQQVVTIDDQGKFNLPGSPRDAFIFITTPKDFRIDRFYIRNRGRSNDYNFAL